MKLTILKWECNIYISNQKKINYFHSNKCVGCDCQDEHKYFATVCTDCCHNANSFARNYFTSTNCYCLADNKNVSCGFFLTLKLGLNNNIYKVCIDEEKKGELGLEINPIKEYLYKKIKASLFLFSTNKKKKFAFA